MDPNLGFQNLVQSRGTRVFALCAANEPWIVVLSFQTPTHPRIVFPWATIPIDFVSLSLPLSRRHRIRDWTPSFPRPLRRSTLVAQNSTLTFAPTFPSESFVRDWKIRIFESNTCGTRPLKFKRRRKEFFFLEIHPFFSFLSFQVWNYIGLVCFFFFFCKSSWRRIRFFLIYLSVLCSNKYFVLLLYFQTLVTFLSNVSKRRDGKNLPITKVSIRRNFCAMAVQTDCHFQMFRTRYICREKER